MHYKKPNLLYYRIAQIASWFAATLLFRRKILRNEIKGKQGPFVVIANHEAMLDFVNLIGMRSRPMSFVISNSFYSSLPLSKFMDKMGVIPKQQFQTTIKDMKRIKSVINHGEGLVIYPAGLMCEDGLSTPIPHATYKFLKWLDADVYVARTSGTYFAMPKWAKNIRPGRTYMDVYKLFSREELARLDPDAVREKTDQALLFDAYEDQETLQVKYRNSDNIEGLEQVLYICPHCMSEFTMQVHDKRTIRCSHCGFEHTCDKYSFLHNSGSVGQELRHVSDWSRLVYSETKRQILDHPAPCLSCHAEFHMIDGKTHKFTQVGQGRLTLSETHFLMEGLLHGQNLCLQIPIENIPTLPFSPGRYVELQHGQDIYRCVPEDGRLVMKVINMVKIFHELRTRQTVQPT